MKDLQLILFIYILSIVVPNYELVNKKGVGL